MKVTGAIRTISTAAAICLVGCNDIGPRSVYNRDPDAKIPAIKAAVSNKDRSVVPQLVKDLDSDDSAVRFYAIRALHDLTGEAFGYNYYLDHDQRKPALVRWQAWLSQQR